MARRRFFVDHVRNGRAEISGDDAHHLTRVLRVEVGQKYEITDNERVWLAIVETARRSVVEFAVERELEAEPDSPPVALCLALVKFDRFEWAVEKATELGIARIVPVNAARSDQGLFEGARKRVERWRRIAREASEQSRRLRAPQIEDPVRFSQVLTEAATHRVWLDERPGAAALLRAFTLKPDDSLLVAVGPEGGWTDPEREQFSAAAWTGVSLGPFILRTETAVCAALGVLAQMGMVREAHGPEREVPGGAGTSLPL